MLTLQEDEDKGIAMRTDAGQAMEFTVILGVQSHEAYMLAICRASIVRKGFKGVI